MSQPQISSVDAASDSYFQNPLNLSPLVAHTLHSALASRRFEYVFSALRNVMMLHGAAMHRMQTDSENSDAPQSIRLDFSVAK